MITSAAPTAVKFSANPSMGKWAKYNKFFFTKKPQGAFLEREFIFHIATTLE